MHDKLPSEKKCSYALGTEPLRDRRRQQAVLVLSGNPEEYAQVTNNDGVGRANKYYKTIYEFVDVTLTNWTDKRRLLSKN